MLLLLAFENDIFNPLIESIRGTVHRHMVTMALCNIDLHPSTFLVAIPALLYNIDCVLLYLRNNTSIVLAEEPASG